MLSYPVKDYEGTRAQINMGNESVSFLLDSDFPLEDVENICNRLEASKTLIPGFIPPSVGVASLEGLLYAKQVQGLSTVIMPDRNLVSRMARVARDGLGPSVDRTTQTSLDVMALAQALNFDIEPSIAFHELAHRQGNDDGLNELRWFRSADHGNARGWVDLACGRANRLHRSESGSREVLDLAHPLSRWKRNYAVVLKIALLELAPISAADRIEKLIQWMVDDFIFAGPAAVFASRYFAPRAAKAGMIKQLRSSDRKRAIAGIRNAAWDLTYLSDFTLRVEGGHARNQRFVLATADTTLSELGSLLFIESDGYDDFESSMATRFVAWWDRDAERVAGHLRAAVEIAQSRPMKTAPKGTCDFLGDLITASEGEILSWSEHSSTS
jgi:hypothetical protein